MARRRNPMPRGAVLISNGKRRERKAVNFKKVIARLKSNGKRRRNPLALRANPLALRMNGKRRHNAKRHNRRRKNAVALRFNGLAVRMNGKRRHNRRRHNGLAIRTNRRRRNGLAIRRNTTPGIVGTIEKMIAKVPVVGKFVAPIAVPAAAAAAIVGAVHAGIKFGMPYLPERVSSMIAPVGYTVGGAVLGMLAALVIPSSILSPASKKAIAGMAIVGGGAVDGIRYLTRDEAAVPAAAVSGLGEGGYWQLAGSDPDGAAVCAYYSDASPADAAYCGADFSAREGEAILAGPRAYAAAFPGTVQVTGTAHGGVSRHSGKEGHRFGFLFKNLGFVGVQALARMPHGKRINTIHRIRNAMMAHHSAGGYGALVLAQ